MPVSIQAIRHALGLSLSEMAEQLGLSGEKASDHLRELERGVRPISGPMQALLDYVAQGADVESDPNEHDLGLALLPRWLDCAGISGDPDDMTEIVMHTRWPRFYAIYRDEFADLSDSERARLADSGINLVPAAPAHGLPAAVILWIDRPARDPSGLLHELQRLKIQQAAADGF